LRFEQEPCTHCRKPLHPAEDDVVVCPDCGAPMHRACWQAEGGCPFAASHGSYLWQPSAAAPEPPPAFDPQRNLGVVCPICGTNQPKQARVCGVCGCNFDLYQAAVRAATEQRSEEQPREPDAAGQLPVPPFLPPPARPQRAAFFVNGRYLSPEDQIDGVTLDDAATHIRGTYAGISRYFSKFERNRVLGWNWAGFFFAPFWLFYRKLYRFALPLAALLLIFTFATLNMSARFSASINPAYTHIGEAMEAAQAAASEEENKAAQAQLSAASKEFYASLRANRVYLLLQAGIWLLPAVATALFGDHLLRRKVWGDVALANAAVEGDEQESRQIRQAVLLRSGGTSFLSVLGWMLCYNFLPALVMQFAEFIMG
jgi:hypothetical protein